MASKGTALVTGASAGLGREFARELAVRGNDLVLVARNQSHLDSLATQLRSDHRVNVEVLVADLSKREDQDRVAQRAAQLDIALVVNNAGYGLNEEFYTNSVDDEQALLDVLVTAVMRITHAALPGMRERRSGGVLNVSSIASWMTSGTYSAAKAWVTTFSESLSDQLRADNVHVMALCPGYIRTEFQQRAGMDTHTIPNWMWLDAGHVVRTSLRDFEKRKRVSVPGLQYTFLALVAQYLPRPLVRRISNVSR